MHQPVSSSSGGAMESPGHILVVDDIEENRALLKRRLARRGYEVTLVDSGQSALDAIAENEFDLVLLDVMMPDMDGLETLERLRHTHARNSLPVIMVTAKSESENIVEALQMGASDYVTKPIDFPVAFARIETHLNLKRTNDALRSSETRQAFLSNMSHELLTPLNAINGFSDLMAGEVLGPLGSAEYQEYATQINNAGEHLLVLISDILDITKIESGTIELAEDTVDIAALVNACILMVREPADAGDVQLLTDLDAEALPPLCADEMRIKQIVLNLVSNAVKFTPPKGTVTVRARFHDCRGFELQVADTGIGISAENLPKAFAQFEQVENTLDRKYDGIGVGLPLTKSLVEGHGGTLDLQSQVDVGTVATVNLPATRAVLTAA